MESQKKRKNGGRTGLVIWALWSLTIVVTVLLILFHKDGADKLGTQDDHVPVFSEQSAKNEHIPANIGVELTPSPILEDNIQIPDKAETESEAESEAEQPVVDSQENMSEEPVEIPEQEEVTEEPQEEPEATPTIVPTGTPVKKRVIDPEKPMVALTFDDGPYRNNTASLLDLFEQYDARATFFVVGYHLDVFYEATVDAYQRGFQIGNHTKAHPALQQLGDEDALEEIRALNEQLNQLGIPGDVMLRPPYGEYTDYLQENVTVPMIGWNVDSRDWVTRDADKIYAEIVGKVKDGDIVLLHDIHDETAAAMQMVVPELVAQGFQLVTVEEMFEAKGIEPEAGQYYCYIR